MKLVMKNGHSLYVWIVFSDCAHCHTPCLNPFLMQKKPLLFPILVHYFWPGASLTKYTPKCACASSHKSWNFNFTYVLTSLQTLDHAYAHLLVVEILYCKLASKYFVQMGDMMKIVFIKKRKSLQSCHQGKGWLLWRISNIKCILICLTLFFGYYMIPYVIS